MNLPKINSLRSSKVEFGKYHVIIKPWTNRDMINYEDRKSQLENSESYQTLNKFQKKYEVDELIFEILIEPNIIESNKKRYSYFEKQVLFIESYKISRGSTITIKIECENPECKQRKNSDFDLNKNVKYEFISQKNFKTKDFEFELRESEYTPDSDGKTDIKFYASYIAGVKFNGVKTVITDLDEFVNWIETEMDEQNYIQFQEEILKILPKIQMTMNYTCPACGHAHNYRFYDLPDFSIVA